MNYHRQHKLSSETFKDRSEREVPSFKPTTSLMNLQRTIGNRALKRVLAGETSSAAIQRDTQPADKPKEQLKALLIVSINGRNLKGNSQTAGYEGAIEVESFNLERSNKNPGHVDSGRERGENEKYQEMILTKITDETTPHIAQAVSEGSFITFKLVSGKIQGDGKFSPNFTIESENATFSSYSGSRSGADTRPVDQFVINYKPSKNK